jgi:hypothetical protein
VTAPRVERSKYRAAADRIREGLWTVDAAAGLVLGVNGPIGFVDADGFVRLGLVLEGRVRMVIRARVVYESVFGPIPDGFEVSHRGCHQDDSIANLHLKRPGRCRGSRNLHPFSPRKAAA